MYRNEISLLGLLLGLLLLSPAAEGGPPPAPAGKGSAEQSTATARLPILDDKALARLRLEQNRL
ncbi:MAG: hypothetical protein DRI34_05155, partial [Deltaproteobacteria bacterium]